MKKEKHLSYRRFCLAFTSVEVLAIIAIIGLLSAISYPIYRYATSNSDIITYQTNILNNAYRQYLAEGGKDASNLEQALAALNREDGIKIQPHRTLTVGSVTYTLTFNPTTSSFSYTSSENSPTPTPTPTPSWNFIGVASRILNVAANGGTATFNGTVSGLEPMPTFMLTSNLVNGTRQFVIHNSGNYASVAYGSNPPTNIGTWYNLTDFLSDLQISSDRFNPSHTKILSLFKDNRRYDWEFLLWRDSNNILNLRTRTISVYSL